jgi:hypothetical protein
MNTPIAVAHAGLGDLPDALGQRSLREAAKPMKVGGLLEPQHLTGSSDRDLEHILQTIHQPPHPRASDLFESTSWSMAWSREISHHLLQAPIRVLELLEAPDLAGHQPAVLLAPSVVGLPRDPSLAADLLDADAVIDLLEQDSNLLLEKTWTPSWPIPFSQPGEITGKLSI